MRSNNGRRLVMIGGTHDGETMAVLYGRAARVPKLAPIPDIAAEVPETFETDYEMYYIEEFATPPGVALVRRHESLSILDCMARLLASYARK